MHRWATMLAAVALGSATLVPGLATAADNPRLNTGSAAGSYNKSFGPLLQSALKKSLFTYDLAVTAGSGENIARARSAPRDIGLVQFDVMALESAADPDLAKDVTVIRSDVAHECLFAVAGKEVAGTVNNWGGVKSLARRLRIATGPENSGAAITLKYLQTIDPELKAATPIYLASVDAAVEAVAKGQAHLAFFVQFPDTTNDRFKAINKAGLTFLPVADRSMLRQTVGGNQVYVAQEVKVSSAMLVTWTGVTKIVTVCTPIAYITGNPEKFPAGSPQRADLEDLIGTVRKFNADALRPQESWYRQMVDGAAVMSESGVDQFLKTVDEAKAKISDATANIQLPKLPDLSTIPGFGK